MEPQPSGNRIIRNFLNTDARINRLIVLITLFYPLLIVAGLAFAIFVAGH